MLKVTVKRKNKGKIVSILDRCLRTHDQEIEDGLTDAAEFLKDESVKLVPIDTGALRNSARVRKVGTGRRAKLFVGYGPFDYKELSRQSRDGKKVDRFPYLYALRVHENIFTGVTGAGGRPNYLREPALARIAEMRARFRARLRLK